MLASLPSLPFAAASAVRASCPEAEDFSGVFNVGAALPRLSAGRVHEAFPAWGGEGAALLFLLGASVPAGQTVWVREAAASAEHGELYAPGLSALADPASVLLVRAQKRVEALWAAEEALKRPGARVLLELGARGKPIDLTATRRLSLVAEAHGASALLLRGDCGRPEFMRAAPTSSAWTRWRIAPAPSHTLHRDEIGAPALTAELMRHRGGVRPRTLDLEWSDDGFRIAQSRRAANTNANEALGGDLAPALGDGPADQNWPRRAVG